MRLATVLLSLFVATTLPVAVDAQDKPKDPPKDASKDAPKKQGTAKKKPAARKPNPVVAAYAAMSAADKIAIQSDLIWTGDFNGIPSSDFGERAIEAVKAFQDRMGSKATGILTPVERAALAAAAKAKQEAAGWRIFDDPQTGARVGVPTKVASQVSLLKDGTRWQSAQGQVQIETFRVNEPGTTLAAVFDRLKKEPATRKVAYGVLRPDFFVISGTQGLKKFYVRAQVKGEEVRGLVILYDQATEGTMNPIVIAMSGAFQGFPLAGPPPKRKVDYGTGIVVNGAGYVVTDRQVTEGCFVVTLPGLGGADVVAVDKANDLALLRVYGARDLTSFAIGEPKSADVTLIGIADPQAQGGGGAATSVKAKVGDKSALDPAPALGFSGAAALDGEGKLAGMAQLKVPVVAGTAPASAQAQFVPVDAIKTFLDAQKIEMTASTLSGVDAAKKSVVRVICARK
jgi:peptidoglycan hydrolase-like protein with peptidoglycan-binding domain